MNYELLQSSHFERKKTNKWVIKQDPVLFYPKLKEDEKSHFRFYSNILHLGPFS